jgi:hypothetical protein
MLMHRHHLTTIRATVLDLHTLSSPLARYDGGASRRQRGAVDFR